MKGSNFTLPTEPAYSAHRDEDTRHREVRAWLARRERETELASKTALARKAPLTRAAA